ncbi:hypothetical protein [Thalassotalea mangrovi]|uniref:Uncharacterized protein n=1 Tax=Thalassotalea mangrovi TaxID=2572245 RepID=A0A4U1BAA8_9GAMM|nr:hypothetical protein [Thalassotalea mangrovi]TKB47453.1 hypothetical protein E8M12_01300 [Thalassotalea mangrovi]
MKDLIVLTAIAYLVHQVVGDHFQLVKLDAESRQVAEIGTYTTLDECRQEAKRLKEKALLMEFLSSSYQCNEIAWFKEK